MENTLEKPAEKVSYGMSLDYVPTWGAWEIVRELTSNAIDTGFEYSVKMKGDNLVIEDSGSGLTVKQLLLGISEKTTDNPIGQFGEGLKLAMLVITRMGLEAEIFTNGLYITNGIEIIADTETFVLYYSENDDPFVGTKIIIHNWEYETFQDKLIDPESSDIACKTRNGWIIYDVTDDDPPQPIKPKLYVNGIYVQDLKDFKYGYNIFTNKINRDRDIISIWEMLECIGNIWQNIDGESAWTLFFEAVASGCKEKDLYIPRIPQDTDNVIKEAFETVYGKNAVISTTENATREAKHRKAKPIERSKFGTYVCQILEQIVGTDESYVEEKMGEKAFNVSYNSLEPYQKESVKAVRRVARKFGFDTNKISIARLPSANGDCDRITKKIRINVRRLNHKQDAISTFLHELAHAEHDTEDLTNQHVKACTDVSAAIIMNAMKIS